MISLYFPGSIVLLMAILTMGNTTFNLIMIILLSVLGFTIANVGNYLLVKYGYYQLLLKIGNRRLIEGIQNNFNANWRKTVILTTFHPSLLSISVICAGIAETGIVRTIGLSFISLLFWVSLVTFLASLLVSRIDIKDENQMIYFFFILIGWGLFLSLKKRKKELSSDN